ncbi:MFS transporter [Actinacidiphila oryziradicis]|nr:MFS transporter [Actinacidiphila oryziradicis]MCW2873128.1 major facilitator superfamily mfs 1 [Actinacidiphila oryziradicis]
MTALPAVYWYLWSGMLINRLGGFAVLYLSLYLTDVRHLSISAAGLVTSLAGAGGMAGVLLGGTLADRWGRRSTLLACHAGTAVALLLLGLAPWLPVVAATTLLVGAGQAMAGPAFVAAIVDTVPEADRTRAFNLQFWAFNLGTAMASLLAGVLAQAGYTLLFVLDAAATTLTLAVLALRLPETRPTAAAAPVPCAARAGLPTVLRDRIFLAFVGLSLLSALVTAQNSTILPLAMHRHGLPPSAYGAVAAFAAGLIVLGQLFVPRLIGGRRKGPVLAVAAALLGCGIALLAPAGGAIGGYLLAALVWTTGSMLAAPPNAAVVAELAPAALRARYQAVFYLVFPAAAFLAPAFGGWSLEHLGDGHWLAAAAIAALAAVGHLAASGPRERRRAAADRAVVADGSGAGSRTQTLDC